MKIGRFALLPDYGFDSRTRCDSIFIGISGASGVGKECGSDLPIFHLAALCQTQDVRNELVRWRQKDPQAAKRISTHRKTGKAIIASIAPSGPPSHHPPIANASSIAALFASSWCVFRDSFFTFVDL
jgi:hypothetical protein